MDSGTRNGSVRSAAGRGGVRTAARLVGTALAALVALGLTPGVAAAAPSRPSDTQIAQAKAAADAVAARVAQLSAQLAAEQEAVEAARTESLIALDEYQATETAYQLAKERADAAAAALAQATAELGVARSEVVAFARRSYMDGSSYAGAAALITAADPGELIERAALLEAAGVHRSDVLGEVTVLREQADAAETVAVTALSEADALHAEAAVALEVAQTAEVAAREQAAQVAIQQVQLETELAQAQQELTRLVGAREAADRTAQAAPAPAPAPKPTNTAPAPLGNTDTAGPGSASAATTAINAAMAYRGLPYAWGGGGTRGPGPGKDPDEGVIGFDCSGLTQYAYAQAGIHIPRNSRAQYAALPKVASSDLRPGDLVFWANDPSDPGTIRHVAIYLGNDRVVQAPQSGDVVRESAMWWKGYAGAVRPSA